MNRKKLSGRSFCSVILAAGGCSERMKGVNKLLAVLDGRPVIIRALEVFERSPAVSEIIVAAGTDDIVPVCDAIKAFGLSKVRCVVRGGASRLASICNALTEVSPKAEYIAVHDAARPFVSDALLARLLDSVKTLKAVIPVLSPKESLKKLDGDSCLSRDRALYALAQTPQVFDSGLLRAALMKASAENWLVTDDAAAVERLGMKISCVEGEDTNIKLTTPADMYIAGAICTLMDPPAR